MPFCALMWRGNRTCGACLPAQALAAKAAVVTPRTTVCYPGLYETVVPLRLWSRLIGLLWAGQVFQRKPAEPQFLMDAHHRVSAQGAEREEVPSLIRELRGDPIRVSRRVQQHRFFDIKVGINFRATWRVTQLPELRCPHSPTSSCAQAGSWAQCPRSSAAPAGPLIFPFAAWSAAPGGGDQAPEL